MMSKSKLLLLCLLVCILLCPARVAAVNIVTYTLLDSVSDSGDRLELTFREISNGDSVTRISVDIFCAKMPFTIYKAEWANFDSVCAPLEPFSLIAATDEVGAVSTLWHISLDFPFTDMFDNYSKLVLTTDKGVIDCPTSVYGVLNDKIDMLCNDYEQQLASSEYSRRSAWLLLAAVAAVVVAAGLIVFVVVRRRLAVRRQRIEELSALIGERTAANRDLEVKVANLYGSRLDTLNMLCNEYFEKRGSDRLKLSLYNEVEKHILALRDPRSLTELETLVNTYLDDILVRVRQQIPALGANDLKFLTYLYAGFSPRAVCVFTDIKIKNFYNRRSRLRDRIIASDAPDRLFFVSKM